MRSSKKMVWVSTDGLGEQNGADGPFQVHHGPQHCHDDTFARELRE